MRRIPRPWLALGVVGLAAAATWVVAQTGTNPPPTPTPALNPALTTPQVNAAAPAANLPPPPPAHLVAAIVNDQKIYELAVYRLLIREIKDKNDKLAEARTEIVNFLIDTTLVDQFVSKFPLIIEKKDVDEKVKQMDDEAIKEASSLKKILESMFLTEDELRDQLTKGLRWDKFCVQQGTDKTLRDFFDKNKNMFDGSEVRARHILLTPPTKTPQAGEEFKARLVAAKKIIEEAVTKNLAEMPPTTPPLEREKERVKLLEKAFAALAEKESDCPSKKEGGDVGWFHRSGVMVEPFSRVAFGMPTFHISDPVTTEFGYHLIMVIDQKQGKEVQFDELKPAVFEVYCERLRDAIVASQRPQAKITINPTPKY